VTISEWRKSTPEEIIARLDEAGMLDAAAEVAVEHGIPLLEVVSRTAGRTAASVARVSLYIRLRKQGLTYQQVSDILDRDVTTIQKACSDRKKREKGQNQ